MAQSTWIPASAGMTQHPFHSAKMLRIFSIAAFPPGDGGSLWPLQTFFYFLCFLPQFPEIYPQFSRGSFLLIHFPAMPDKMHNKVCAPFYRGYIEIR